jgi:hypothetical protein
MEYLKLKRNTLTLQMYFYSNNSFPLEAVVCSVYTNKYYFYNKE